MEFPTNSPADSPPRLPEAKSTGSSASTEFPTNSLADSPWRIKRRLLEAKSAGSSARTEAIEAKLRELILEDSNKRAGL